MPLASTEATAVGLQGGSVDIIATDWLWVSRERSGGADFTFSPFTTALGSIMVPPDSPDQDARATSRARSSAWPAARSTRAGS